MPLRRARRPGEPPPGNARRCGRFGADAAVLQRDGVAVGCADLRLLPERRSQRRLIERTGERHQQNVAHRRTPRAVQVRLRKAPDRRVRMLVPRAGDALARVGTGLHETERIARAGERVTLADGTDERINPADEVFRRLHCVRARIRTGLNRLFHGRHAADGAFFFLFFGAHKSTRFRGLRNRRTHPSQPT